MDLDDHYYSHRPQTKSNESKFSVDLRDQHMVFYTDHGVFSKGKIDAGTIYLLTCLQVETDAKILDIGCGYGPVGLTLAKESIDRQLVMVDVNERAVHLSKKNSQENQLNHVRILTSDLFDLVRDYDFDHIISNPPIRAGKKVVYQLFEKSFDHLVNGGSLWVVIQKKQGSDSALRKLKEQYDVEEIGKHKGYRVFRAIKSKDF